MEPLLPHPKNTSSASLAVLTVASMLFFSGCGLSDLVQIACDTTGNDPHCAQEAAVQSDAEDNCDRVAQKEEFKKVGSNPPRDKCVVMVAANNEDPEKCDKVKGGAMSYTKEDCLKAISDTARNPETCSKLGKGDIGSCINNVAQKTFDDVERLNKMKTKSTENVQELQEKMRQLEKTMEMLTNINKTRFDMERSVVGNLRG